MLNILKHLDAIHKYILICLTHIYISFNNVCKYNLRRNEIPEEAWLPSMGRVVVKVVTVEQMVLASRQDSPCYE